MSSKNTNQIRENFNLDYSKKKLVEPHTISVKDLLKNYFNRPENANSKNFLSERSLELLFGKPADPYKQSSTERQIWPYNANKDYFPGRGLDEYNMYDWQSTRQFGKQQGGKNSRYAKGFDPQPYVDTYPHFPQPNKRQFEIDLYDSQQASIWIEQVIEEQQKSYPILSKNGQLSVIKNSFRFVDKRRVEKYKKQINNVVLSETEKRELQSIDNISKSLRNLYDLTLLYSCLNIHHKTAGFVYSVPFGSNLSLERFFVQKQDTCIHINEKIIPVLHSSDLSERYNHNIYQYAKDGLPSYISKVRRFYLERAGNRIIRNLNVGFVREMEVLLTQNHETEPVEPSCLLCYFHFNPRVDLYKLFLERTSWK